MTKRGISTILEESPYIYECNDMQFYFSSKFYLNNFSKLAQTEIDRFNIKTSSMWKDKFNLEMQNLALVRLYAIIEKRGFFIKIRGDSVECLDNVEFQMVPMVKEG
jgi:hypothetical protein